MTLITQLSATAQLDQYTGCLLGGAVGDALGAAVEFMSLSEIRRLFGNDGITTYQPGEYPLGAITDDTQMMMFTAEGLLRAQSREMEKGIASTPEVVHRAYLRWLTTQTKGDERVVSNRKANSEALDKNDRSKSDGWLIETEELFNRRAPGNTCLSALSSGRMGTIEKPINDSKGCGGVMRVAPVGLIWSRSDHFDLGCEVAALTHGHPSGYLAAGCFALIINELIRSNNLQKAVAQTIEVLKTKQNHEECLQAIELALSLFNSGETSAETVERIGQGWIAEEAIAIAIYCALAARGDFRRAILLGVNHSGDSDSTGSITGNIMGAMLGKNAIPREWLDSLELRTKIEMLGQDMFIAHRTDDEWWQKYPGW